MNGYDLTQKMRKARRTASFTVTEQALYHELAAICNDAEWPDVFDCSNAELCHSLNISENTLLLARQRLIEAGLLYYSAGKSRRKFSSYSFKKKLNSGPTTAASTSKFDAVPEVVEEKKGSTTPATTAALVAASTSKSEDYTKLKGKQNSSSIEEEATPPPARPFSNEFFTGHWARWKKYRTQKRKTIHPGEEEDAALRNLEKIAGGDEAIAAKIINKSISQGWQGLFELKPSDYETSSSTQRNSGKSTAGRSIEFDRP